MLKSGVCKIIRVKFTFFLISHFRNYAPLLSDDNTAILQHTLSVEHPVPQKFKQPAGLMPTEIPVTDVASTYWQQQQLIDAATPA